MRYSLLKLKLDIPLLQYRHNYTGQFVMVGCKHLCCAHLKGVLYFGRSSRVPDSAVNIYIPPTLHVSWQEHRSSSFFPLTSQCSQRTKKTVSPLQRAIKNRHKHPHWHTAHKTKNNFLVLSFSFCVDDQMSSSSINVFSGVLRDVYIDVDVMKA